MVGLDLDEYYNNALTLSHLSILIITESDNDEPKNRISIINGENIPLSNPRHNKTEEQISNDPEIWVCFL